MKTRIDIYADNRAVMPLICWDIFSQYLNKSYDSYSKKELEIKQLNSFASKFKWENDIKSILSTNSYEALVLTDVHKKILWVSDGFASMTGYSKEFAKGKQPLFLQGEDSFEKRIAIRKKLAKQLPFKEVIINYRKNGTPYNCEVYIIPLKNDKVTHFLALEKDVS